ncbi:MAG: hypothetical protein AMXMBFR16_10750 [Candidatus Uhrbacteria bacterium]
MTVNYAEKISRWDHDRNFFVEEDVYKFRPGQQVFVYTGMPEIRVGEIVEVAYPEGYEYRWVVKDRNMDARYIIGDSHIFATYEEAYAFVSGLIADEITRCERQAILAKARLQDFAEKFKCQPPNLSSLSTTNNIRSNLPS